MCITYAWRYSCGCISPKLAIKPLYRCNSCHCISKNMFSYLDVACSPKCIPGATFDQLYDHDAVEKKFYYGKYVGMTSQEDRYFGRSRSPEGCRSETQMRYGCRSGHGHERIGDNACVDVEHTWRVEDEGEEVDAYKGGGGEEFAESEDEGVITGRYIRFSVSNVRGKKKK